MSLIGQKALKICSATGLAVLKELTCTSQSMDTEETFTVFTTRPDTLFGATYAVFAPEHAFVEKITTAEQKEAVEAYIRSN